MEFNSFVAVAVLLEPFPIVGVLIMEFAAVAVYVEKLDTA